MSDDKNTVTFDTLTNETAGVANTVKTFIAELPENEYVFEYGRVEKRKLREITDEYTRINARPGKKPDLNEVEVINEDKFNAEIVCEGLQGVYVVNDGEMEEVENFPLSPEKMSQQDDVFLSIIDELSNCIEEHSTIDDEVRQKFRGGGI